MLTTDSRYGKLTAYLSAIAIVIMCFATCEPAAGQRIKDVEKAVLVSSEKIKHSTNLLICVKTESGKVISFKYNIHCYRCRVVNVPVNWTVVTSKRNKSFIKPQL